MNFEIITLKKEGITDFAKERNRTLRQAQGKWVFFLDSDETINNLQFSRSLDRLLINNEFSGYKIKRDNYFLGKYVGSEWLVRLADKNSGKWVRRVHETWEIEGKIGELNNPVIIHNTAGNLADYIKKINLYSTLHARADKEEGKTSSLFKIIFFPAAKFIATYFKSRHIVFSIMQASHSFLSWSKLYFLRS